jgi:CheY-like chemotaxis protein
MVVLIVDDERVVAESTAEIFLLAGHDAYSASSAEEALTIAKRVRPDLLVTDVMMPGKNGIELAITLLAKVPGCQVLLISGQAETSDLLEMAEEKGHRFEIVAKPLWPPDLVRHAELIVANANKNSDAARAS